ncbi:hypothetical protein AB6F61_20850 [Providencia hangzhouensis]|uniref:hypothetical protein n=1 Tax=Providencia hangzhouensis TaxID=3031799 RepID=UPI0034DD7F64
MSEVSHLATDKDIVTIVTALIGAACLVIGGAIGFFTKYFYENKKINESKKALRQQMITNNIAPMRQAWINDVRKSSADIIADFHFILYTHLAYENKSYEKLKSISDETALKLQYKISYLQLLLPSTNRDEKSKKIDNLIDDLMDLTYLKKGKLNKKDVDDKLEEIAICTQELLKKEWEVTKSLEEME